MQKQQRAKIAMKPPMKRDLPQEEPVPESDPAELQAHLRARGGEMVLRKRKSDGKPFYGCKRYPACRGIKNVE